MMTPDVNVFLIDFPNSGNEMVVLNEDGTYTVLINARLSNDGQLKAYEHAMKHITEHDFERNSVQNIESVAHGLITESNAKPIPADKYIEEIRRIQRRRKKLHSRMRQEEERLRFLQENFDMYALAENYHLYGDDL